MSTGINQLNIGTPVIPKVSGNISGLLGSLNLGLPAAPKPVSGITTTPVPVKTQNSGIIQNGQQVQIPVAPTPPSTAKIQTTPSGAHVNANTGGVVTPTGIKFDSNVLTQQKQLNALGAGLKEDGLLGPLTLAAIQKYGTPGGSSNTSTNGTGGTTPTPPPPQTNPTTPYNPLQSPLYTSPEYEAAIKNYKNFAVPSAEELAAQQKIIDYTGSYHQAQNGIADQTIPMGFITGQQASTERRYNAGITPLQQTAALLQGKRTAALEASKFTLDAEKNKIDAYRDYNKPVGVSIGTSLVNPATGASVFGGGSSDVLGKAISEGRLSPDMVTRYGQAAILQALQFDPNYNFITQKSSVNADSASLKTQQDYADTTSRAYNTATANLKVLNDLVSKSGLNQSSIPLINQLTNKIKAGITDPGSVAAFHSALEGLRTEYAQVLSRGGQVTDSARSQANALIPDNLSPQQLQQVLTTLQKEGANAIKEANDKVNEIKGRISSNAGSSNKSTIGDSWDNLF